MDNTIEISSAPQEAAQPRPPRVHLLDGLRGVAIVAMVLQHLLFDLTEVFYRTNVPDWMLTLLHWCRDFSGSFLLNDILQPAFQCLFVLISGMACRYSRSNLRRGARVLLFGCLLTFVTCVVLPAMDPVLFSGVQIRFGILHMLGCSMLLWGLLGGLFDRLTANRVMGVVVPCLLLIGFGVFYVLSERSWDVQGLYWLGFAHPSFFSADYFPLLPWTLLFFFGAWAGKYLRAGRFPRWVYTARLPVFDFVGRHTLLIYLLHQPVVFGLCYLVFEVWLR